MDAGRDGGGVKLLKAITLFALNAACCAISVNDGRAGWAAAMGFLAGAHLIIAIHEYAEWRDENSEVDDAEEEDAHHG